MSKKKVPVSEKGGSRKNQLPPVIPFEEEIKLESAFVRDRTLMDGAFDEEAPIVCMVPSLRIVEDDTFQNFLRRQKKENKELMHIDLDSMLSVYAMSLLTNKEFEHQRQNA